jgi:hypothetical protein
VGPIGGKGRPSVGKVREWYVESRHLQGCSPRLCQLRTPVSKYWTYRSHTGIYGPSKPSSWLPSDAWLCPHYFIGWLGRETGYGPADRSAGVLWIVSGALFLGSSGPTQLCWWLCERLLYVDHVRYVWSWTIHGLSVESVWCVGRIFPCRVYIDSIFPCRMYINSNRRDSKIWVTTFCSSHHVDNLMAWFMD